MARVVRVIELYATECVVRPTSAVVLVERDSHAGGQRIDVLKPIFALLDKHTTDRDIHSARAHAEYERCSAKGAECGGDTRGSRGGAEGSRGRRTRGTHHTHTPTNTEKIAGPLLVNFTN